MIFEVEISLLHYILETNKKIISISKFFLHTFLNF